MPSPFDRHTNLPISLLMIVCGFWFGACHSGCTLPGRPDVPQVQEPLPVPSEGSTAADQRSGASAPGDAVMAGLPGWDIREVAAKLPRTARTDESLLPDDLLDLPGDSATGEGPDDAVLPDEAIWARIDPDGVRPQRPWEARAFAARAHAGERTPVRPDPLSPPPRPGGAGGRDLDAPLRVVVISDLNSSYGSFDYRDEVHQAVEVLVNERPDLVLSTGDMVAGQRQRVNLAGMWAAFHRSVTQPLWEAGIPLAVTPGNHDASGYTRWQHERDFYAREFEAWRPDLQFLDATDYPLRYSFAVEDVLFLSLDSTTLGAMSDEQMAWIDGQLTAYGPQYATRIAFAHVPIWPIALGRHREAMNDPRVEELLNRHNLDLLITGHHHAYYPGRRGPLRMLAMPCLGNGNRVLSNTAERSRRGIVRLEIHPGGRIEQVDAFTGENLDRVISRWSLPPFIGRGPGVIVRDDLPWRGIPWLDHAPLLR